MAVISIRSLSDLGDTFVLAPERYDLRRDSLQSNAGKDSRLAIKDFAEVIRIAINPKSKKIGNDRKCIVLDTCDAREGILIGRKISLKMSDLGSQKKSLKQGDVIISRLRPYLRQVAYVDDAFATAHGDVEITCSTEFFILRSLSNKSIAFLVSYLLSKPVQVVLAASQEGGHHPRFNEEALLALPIPQDVLDRSAGTSKAILDSVSLYRRSEEMMHKLINETNEAIA